MMKSFLNTLSHYDRNVFLWLQKTFPQPSIHKISQAVSKTGDGPMYAALGIALVLLDKTQGALILAVSLAAFAIERPIYLLLKRTFKRTRPCDLQQRNYKAIIASDQFSLPSGHTAAAFLVATIITFFYSMLAPLAFTWAALIGCSRVLLGVHYPLDILAGALLGTVCAQSALFFITQ